MGTSSSAIESHGLSSVPNLVISVPRSIYPRRDDVCRPGPLSEWTNSGALGGVFCRAPAAGIPSVATVQNTNGVTFNGTTHFYTGPVAPAFHHRLECRTIEAWVLQPGDC
jgi:hypothetical protein